MWNILAKILSIVFFFVVLIAPSTADIRSFKFRSDDQHLIVFENFAFTKTGHVSVSVSSVLVTGMLVTSDISRPDPSRIGFYLISDYAIDDKNYEDIACDLDSKFISLFFTFKDLSPPDHSSFNTTYAVTYPGLYYLRFANCNPLSHVTMDVRTEFYNTINGTTKDYLSSEQTNLPSLYFYFSIIYMCLLVFWILVLLKYNSSVHHIHLLMVLLLVMKGLNLLCAIKVLQYMKVTGVFPHWNYLFYIIQFIRSVLFYTVIAGILQRKLILIGVIPLQVLATVFSKMIVQVLYEDTYGWVFGLYMADSICNCLLVLPIGSAIYKSSRTNQAVENHSVKFILFCIVFCVYWLLDFMAGVAVSVAYSYSWSMAAEITSLALYMVMFFMFRPSEENQYLFPVAPVLDKEIEL